MLCDLKAYCAVLEVVFMPGNFQSGILYELRNHAANEQVGFGCSIRLARFFCVLHAEQKRMKPTLRQFHKVCFILWVQRLVHAAACPDFLQAETIYGFALSHAVEVNSRMWLYDETFAVDSFQLGKWLSVREIRLSVLFDQ